MTHWKKLTNPLYLGAYSLEDGKDIVLTIKEVKQEQVVGADGKKEECTVCHFKENAKPMILNSTNCKAIQKLAGTPYIEKWAGVAVQIGTEKVKAFGDVVDALRIRKTAPKAPSKAEPAIICEGCGNPIQAAYGMSASEFAEYSKTKLGKKLCAACAKSVSEATEKPKQPETDPNTGEVIDETE